MTLAVSPRAGDSHKVGGEFAEDQFQLLMCRFPGHVLRQDVAFVP